MNTTPEDILVNPKLTLIAFHLCQELTQEKTADAESIWSRLAKISSYIKIPELQQLPQLIQQSQAIDSDRCFRCLQSDRYLFSQPEKIEPLLFEPVFSFAHPASD